jgi:hypothetical protein
MNISNDPGSTAATSGPDVVVIEPAVWAELHHWVNTIVGMLDASFRLSDDEQFYVLDIVTRLLDTLEVPYRDDPAELPASVAHEVTSGMFSAQLAGVREAELLRPTRTAVEHDIVVSVAAWRTALLSMLLTAYPDLAPFERITAAKVFDDLLVALGAPDRVARYFPAEVVAAYYDVDLTV